jgi:hypothetical protein
MAVPPYRPPMIDGGGLLGHRPPPPPDPYTGKPMENYVPPPKVPPAPLTMTDK